MSSSFSLYSFTAPKLGLFQKRAFFILGFCWCNMLLWQGCISISMQELAAKWKLTSIELGAIGSCHTFGIMVGSYAWGYLGNSKGRLWALRWVTLTNVLFGILYTCTVDIYMVAVCAFLVGLCGGGAQVLTGTLYMEYLESSEKWTFMVLTIFISLGGMLAYSCALVVVATGDNGFNVFRWVGLFNVVCMIGNFFSLKYLYESPLFLLRAGKEEEGERVLK